MVLAQAHLGGACTKVCSTVTHRAPHQHTAVSKPCSTKKPGSVVEELVHDGHKGHHEGAVHAGEHLEGIAVLACHLDRGGLLSQLPADLQRGCMLRTGMFWACRFSARPVWSVMSGRIRADGKDDEQM